MLWCARIDEGRNNRLLEVARRTHKDRSVLLREAVDLVLAVYEGEPKPAAPAQLEIVDLTELAEIRFSMQRANDILSALASMSTRSVAGVTPLD